MSKHSYKIAEGLKLYNEIPKSTNMNPYCLTHYYDEKLRRFYVEAPYDFDTFQAICAYIQYELSELDMTYSMDQTEVIEILETFYDCKKVKRTRASQVDLYYNWEYFCGVGLQEVECLKRDGMDVLLQKYVDEFHAIKTTIV
jgi:hypothetical protein